VDIYRGALPFVALQMVGLALTILFPALVFGPIRFFRD
jgi:TRAP-type mannitol/chloroaromatic compound transport system permease large subunit